MYLYKCIYIELITNTPQQSPVLPISYSRSVLVLVRIIHYDIHLHECVELSLVLSVSPKELRITEVFQDVMSAYLYRPTSVSLHQSVHLCDQAVLEVLNKDKFTRFLRNVGIYQPKRRHIPKNSNLGQHRCQKVKSCNEFQLKCPYKNYT
jgi:hypothetical protein